MLALGFFAAVLALVVVLLMLRRQSSPEPHMSTTEAVTWRSPTPDPATGCLTPDDQAILFTANGVIRGRSLDIGRNLSSNDCLYFNIWTPPTCRHTEKGNKTVIVALVQDWFRTTRFTTSPAWKELAASEDVVVVVPSHRMGLLGFLNTGNQGIPGNVGLFDLLLALRWIKENAAEFGGDAESVVALGQGSGAAMLTLALRSLGRRFFKRAVLQDMSPFTMMPRNDRHVGKQRALRLCRLLGCHVHAGDVASLYLQRSYSEGTLLSYAVALDEVWFVPSFDQEPLIYPPERLVDESGLDGVDLLCGVDRRAAEVLFQRHLLPLLKTEGAHMLS
ncbi:cholinesterase-like [Amblyomma americanum]